MPCSGTADIALLDSSSNIGEPGVWMFRIDGETVIPACYNEGLLTLLKHPSYLILSFPYIGHSVVCISTCAVLM